MHDYAKAENWRGTTILSIRKNNEIVIAGDGQVSMGHRSEEHTSELQSRSDLVCRLLLEKKNDGQLFKLSSMKLRSPKQIEVSTLRYQQLQHE